MTKTVKALALILAALLAAVCLSGCIVINKPAATDVPESTQTANIDDTDAPGEDTPEPMTEAPTAEPTPAPTEEPTPAPTPEPTPTPTPTPEPTPTPFPNPDLTYELMLQNGKTVQIDLDMDGLADSVTYKQRYDAAAEESFFKIEIVLGSNPGNKFQHEVCSSGGFGMIIDCDPEDDRLEVIMSTTAYEYDGSSTVEAYRVTDGGGTIKHSHMSGYLEKQSGHYIKEGKLKIGTDTDIFGTNVVYAKYVVNSSGIKCTSSMYTYAGGGNIMPGVSPRVIVAMPAYHVTSGGGIGDLFYVPVGTYLEPVKSDLRTLVYIKLDTGEYAYVKITVNYGDWPPAYINGYSQDYYMDIPYAG